MHHALDVWNLAAQGGAQQPFDPSSIFMLVLVFAFIYFFLLRPQKREAEEKQKLLDSLKKNDRVVTTGGILGTIVNLKDNEVTLRVDDQNKVKIRVLRSAIARVMGPESSTDDSKKT
ncbi:MAG: preprotein translocase subunit YajC [Planctomycetota bacterium]